MPRSLASHTIPSRLARRRPGWSPGRFETLECRHLLSGSPEFKVELQTHPVAGPFDHLSLLITPVDQTIYTDTNADGRADQDHLFVKRTDGTFGLSIGAGLGNVTKLVADFNRPGDIALHGANDRFTLTKPGRHATTRAWLESLVLTADAYGDGLTYTPFPAQPPTTSYNSNSFIAGLLAATGTSPPNLATVFPAGNYPGYTTPVPSIEFFVMPTVSVVEVIDRSGSMGGGKLTSAKNAATLFAELLSEQDYASVVSFDHQVSLDLPLTQIGTDFSGLNQVKSAIAGLSAGGTTAIGLGLRMAGQEVAGAAAGTSRAIVLLSDGFSNTGPDPLDVINEIDPSVRVFTIGLGSADRATLTAIAQARGGKYYDSPDAADLQAIYTELLGVVTGAVTLVNENRTINPLENQSRLLQVPSGASVTFGINWGGSDLDLTLVSPSGVQYGGLLPVSGSRYVTGPTYEFFRVTNPEAGNWTIRVAGVDVPRSAYPYNLYAYLNPNTSTNLNTAPTLNTSGNPYVVLGTGSRQSAEMRQGVLVSDILARGAGGDPINDPDEGAVDGIAITSVDNSLGTFEYTLVATNPLDGDWVPFGAGGTISATSALLLPPTARIRFNTGRIPHHDFGPDFLTLESRLPTGILFKAWDGTTGQAGGRANTTAAGGLSSFSVAVESVAVYFEARLFRVFNTNAQLNVYTLEAEFNVLANLPGYQDRSTETFTGFTVLLSDVPEAGTAPLYRMYYGVQFNGDGTETDMGYRYLTTNRAEAEALELLGPAHHRSARNGAYFRELGVNRGTAALAYVFSSAQSGTLPLTQIYRTDSFRKPTRIGGTGEGTRPATFTFQENGDHVYTTSTSEDMAYLGSWRMESSRGFARPIGSRSFPGGPPAPIPGDTSFAVLPPPPRAALIETFALSISTTNNLPGLIATASDTPAELPPTRGTDDTTSPPASVAPRDDEPVNRPAPALDDLFTRIGDWAW